MRNIRLFYMISFAVITLTSCKKENASTASESLITTISGKFNNWALGADCRIIICQYNTQTYNYTKLDSSNIDTNGNFNIKLTSIPQLQNSNFGDSVQVSNSSTKMSSGMLWLKIFKTNQGLIKSAFYGKRMNPGSEPVAGDFGIGYIYVDSDIEVESTRKVSTMNLNLSKGWNKIVQKYTTATISYVSIDFSDSNLAGAAWINY